VAEGGPPGPTLDGIDRSGDLTSDGRWLRWRVAGLEPVTETPRPAPGSKPESAER